MTDPVKIQVLAGDQVIDLPEGTAMLIILPSMGLHPLFPITTDPEVPPQIIALFHATALLAGDHGIMRQALSDEARSLFERAIEQGVPRELH